MFARVIVLLAFAAPWIHVYAMTEQLYCASPDKTGAFKYDANAVACDNVFSEQICQLDYPASIYPKAGGYYERPANCYKDENGTNAALVEEAIATCPKTCGFCCKSTPYKCEDKKYPMFNCSTLTPAKCINDRNGKWQPLYVEHCRAACGLCNEEICGDLFAGCASDPTICNAMGMEQFVNKNCRKTCGRCGATTCSGCTDIVEAMVQLLEETAELLKKLKTLMRST